MADDKTLGAYNIFDLRDMALRREEVSRVMALLGARNVAELSPEFLHFTDNTFRRPSATRADLKLVDTARAAEG